MKRPRQPAEYFVVVTYNCNIPYSATLVRSAGAAKGIRTKTQKLGRWWKVEIAPLASVEWAAIAPNIKTASIFTRRVQ